MWTQRRVGTGNPGALVAVLCLAAGAVAWPVRVSAADPDGGDLEAVLSRGVLRHLGVPYARFVSGGGEGFDVELMSAFASHLGVRYTFVETTWTGALGDLTGRRVSAREPDPARAAPCPIRGDVLATGLTVLPWRRRSVEFSRPTFPTQVWVVAPRDSPVKPIVPTGDVERDIAEVKRRLKAKRVLGVPNTCLDPGLYAVEEAGGRPVRLDTSRLDDVAPALLRGEGDLALIDVADADLAFERWPGRFTVLGPVSPVQEMAAAFRKDAPELRKAFDAFLVEARKDGTYDRLLERHFPRAGSYFPGYFQGEK
jgi:ABC-type amino acid transport substrate-binding protein